jgi:hypothetical protein
VSKLNTLLLTLVTSAACGSTYPEPWIPPGDSIPFAPMADGWSLHRGYEVTEEGPVIGLPDEAFQRVIAVRGDRTRLLRTPADLKGIVRIETDRAALAFVRLFTNLDTFYLFDGDQAGFVEVTPTDAAKVGFAEMPRSEFARLKLFVPRVRSQEDGFVVERCVARGLGGSKAIVYEVAEMVSYDGTYSITKNRKAEEVRLFVPGFW